MQFQRNDSARKKLHDHKNQLIDRAFSFSARLLLRKKPFAFDYNERDDTLAARSNFSANHSDEMRESLRNICGADRKSQI